MIDRHDLVLRIGAMIEEVTALKSLLSQRASGSIENARVLHCPWKALGDLLSALNGLSYVVSGCTIYRGEVISAEIDAFSEEEIVYLLDRMTKAWADDELSPLREMQEDATSPTAFEKSGEEVPRRDVD